jgi:hypothetical protein
MDNRRRTLNDNTSLGRFVQLSLQTCFEQVEEYTCLNTDSSEILVSNIK